MTRSFMLGMGAAGVLFVFSCGGSTSSKTSSSSHWIECDMDRDCDEVPGAAACESGYCVDGEGERIPKDSLDTVSTSDTTASSNQTNSAATSSSSGSGSGGSGNGGSGAEPAVGTGGRGGSGQQTVGSGGVMDPGTSSGGGAPPEFEACDVNTAMYGCMGSVCHGQPGVQSPVTLGAGLDLFRDDRETWLIDRPATYLGVSDTSNCPDVPELLVDTKNPMDSLIIKKIEGRQSCGTPEPIVGELSREAQQCITDWVLWLAANGS